MTKEELKSITIEQLNGISEGELSILCDEIIEKLHVFEIKKLPIEVREKLGLKQQTFFSAQTWITIILGGLAAAIIGAIFGK